MTLTEALDTFDTNLEDIRKVCVFNMQQVAKEVGAYRKMSDTDERTVRNILLHVNYLTFTERTRHYMRAIKRIDSKKRPPHQRGITDEDIARVKEIPLADLYDGRLFGRRNKTGYCPFHQDRTPSFNVFPDNRFKCFGCGVNGTSIDFIMLRDNTSFVEAVKKLL